MRGISRVLVVMVMRSWNGFERGGYIGITRARTGSELKGHATVAIKAFWPLTAINMIVAYTPAT